MIIVAVFVGGALGSMLRFTLTLLEAKVWAGSAFPNDGRGTLGANVIASFLIGLFQSLLVTQSAYSDGVAGLFQAQNSGASSVVLTSLLVAGLCGGLSTFSSLALEILGWLKDKRWGRMTVMTLANSGFGVAAFIVGMNVVGMNIAGT